MNAPTWLTISENGSKGEARTKAILLDRFWVLERSVDIEGADFIIQARLGPHTLDKGPTRFGLVQSKFFQTDDTNAYVHFEYVCNNKGEPWPEFFVLIHSRVEDDQEIFFLTAQQIIDNFDVVPDGNMYAGRFKIKGKTLFASNSFKRKKKEILDIMQDALRRGSLAENRSYMSQFVPESMLRWMQDEEIVKINKVNVIASFKDDDSGAFKLVNEWKDAAKQNYEEVKNLKYLLEDILRTRDPIEALCAVSDFAYREGEFKKFRALESRPENHWREIFRDFFETVFRYRLRECNAEVNWAVTEKKIEEKVQAWLETVKHLTQSRYWLIKAEINADFTLHSINFTPEAEHKSVGMAKWTYAKCYEEIVTRRLRFAEDFAYDVYIEIAKQIATEDKDYDLPESEPSRRGF
jgi:hypothetical protein